MVGPVLAPVPEIPETLREAAARGTLVPFVGAGVSRLSGIPGWVQLADKALDYFREQKKIDYAQVDQLRELPPRVKLSIALGLQEEFKTKIDFQSILEPKGEATYDHPDGLRAYAAIGQLGNLYVTTNYDRWLERVLVPPPFSVESGAVERTTTVQNRRVVHRPAQLDLSILGQKGAVVHLHGSLEEPDSLVVSTSDYLERYSTTSVGGMQAEGNRVVLFLRHLFQTRQVLFVGYGAEELEILEFVLLKAKSERSGDRRELRHFLLEGFYSQDLAKMKFLKDYFAGECGIDLMPFQKDKEDHHQLIFVLEELARQVPVGELLVSEKMREMAALLDV